MNNKTFLYGAIITVTVILVVVWFVLSANTDYRISDGHRIEVIEGHEYITNGKYMCHSVSCKYCKNK